MEKYSKWRDSGTGIQPFLQPVPARAQQGLVAGALQAVKNYAAGPVVALARLAVLGVLAAVDGAAAAVGALLVVPGVRRGWARCTRS
ncbi:hypothetical protein IWQ57_000831, partial [Coemansia nantahalensis]